MKKITHSSFSHLNRIVPHSISLFALFSILCILSINVQPAFSQTGTVQVESNMNVTGKISIQPQGDIGMGIFQPISNPGTIIDTDFNGMPDNWEVQYFGHLGNNATADPDNDGVSNLNEYLQGTNPVVPNTPPPSPTLPPMNGMEAWYQGGEAYTTVAMTQKCSVSGTDTCALLRDLSGNNRHLLQSDPLKRPIYESGQNNTQNIKFDGLNDELLLSSYAKSQPISIFMVVKANSYSGSDQDWLSMNSTGNGIRLKNDATNLVAHSGAATGASIVRPTVGGYVLIQANFTSTSSFIQQGKKSPATGTGSTLNTTAISLGSGNNQRWANIDCREVLIYQGNLDAQSGDGLWIRQYLDAKYSLGIFSTLKPPQDFIFAHYNAENAYKDFNVSQLCEQSGVDEVAAFKDLTGNQRHLLRTNIKTQSPLTFYGITQWFMDLSNHLNQKPIIRGANSLGGGPSFKVDSLNLPGDKTVYIVVKPSDGNFTLGLGSGSSGYSIQYNVNNYFSGWITNWSAAPAGYTPNQYQIVIMQVFSTASVQLQIDNQTSKLISGEPNSVCTYFAMAPFNADVAEVIIYNTAHDLVNQGEGMNVKQFLNNKYNLNLPLP